MHNLRQFVDAYRRGNNIPWKTVAFKNNSDKINTNNTFYQWVKGRNPHIFLPTVVDGLKLLGLELHLVEIPVDLSPYKYNASNATIKLIHEGRYYFMSEFINFLRFHKLSCRRISSAAGDHPEQLYLTLKRQSCRLLKLQDYLQVVGLHLQIREIVPNAHTSGRQENGKGVQYRHRAPNEGNVLQTNG